MKEQVIRLEKESQKMGLKTKIKYMFLPKKTGKYRIRLYSSFQYMETIITDDNDITEDNDVTEEIKA